MKLAKEQETITIRLPADVYTEVQDAARRHKTSLNRFVLEAVSQRLKQENFKALNEAFTLVGQEENNDVDYAFEAQAEIVLRGEN